MEKYNLEPTPFVLTKIHQIYEMILVRHGFMIVGDPLGGKTKDYQLLAEALTIMGRLSTRAISRSIFGMMPTGSRMTHIMIHVDNR